ncbi:MAG: translation elongation factor Ts [Gammaproteobacteria bacterium]|nr:translation elongation factor Ts [Gammaproteobacteria bacterium]MDE0650673.1 translation elongation factor Ts [Gammaproteobacteria bacterium]MXW10914.1 translation elongation factor Ts [Gammaproteobacteria bacterium]MYC52275.1 translation elongation factor Ts [Gammaproteobacteria bacterium]
MTIPAKMVKALRDRTGGGMMDCKRALEETGGDLEAAVDLLRARGAAKVSKRAGRDTNQGTIGSYVHFDRRVGVIVEVNCETDFVANTDDFRALAKDIALHIASQDPIAVRAEDLPQDVVEREKAVYREQVRAQGKPERIQDMIVQGKLKAFYKDQVLLEQPFIKDTARTIGELVTEVSAKTGEKIEVARFSRFAVGQRG